LVIKRFDELTINELYEILKLRAEVFVVEQECAYQDIDNKDRHCYHLMNWDDGELVGYARIVDKEISYDVPAIGRVITAMGHRGRGIASEIVEWARDFILGELDEDEIRLSAQAHLVDFYGRAGFRAIGEGYLEDGIPHIEMVYER
jgi:ElaA protein